MSVETKMAEMFSHPCHSMERWENPQKFQLGWKCKACGKSWTYGLFSELKKITSKIWREFIVDAAGRNRMTAMMNGSLYVWDEVPE